MPPWLGLQRGNLIEVLLGATGRVTTGSLMCITAYRQQGNCLSAQPLGGSRSGNDFMILMTLNAPMFSPLCYPYLFTYVTQPLLSCGLLVSFIVLPFYCSIVFGHVSFSRSLIPLYFYSHDPPLVRISHLILPHSLSSLPFR